MLYWYTNENTNHIRLIQFNISFELGWAGLGWITKSIGFLFFFRVYGNAVISSNLVQTFRGALHFSTLNFNDCPNGQFLIHHITVSYQFEFVISITNTLPMVWIDCLSFCHFLETCRVL